MSAVKKAFEHLTHGIETTFKGVGDVAKGIFTLDLKGIAKGVKEIHHGIGETVVGVVDFTPVGLCANTLLNGALDKALTGIKGLMNDGFDLALDIPVGIVDGGLKHGFKGLSDGIMSAPGQVIDGFSHGADKLKDLPSEIFGCIGKN